MKLITYPEPSQWAELLQRPVIHTEALFDTVRQIMARVKAEGDRAVLAYEATFDRVELSQLAVSEEEWLEAETQVSEELKKAILLAKENIASFHAKQCFVGQKVETAPGVFCWQKAVPIEKVGLYIPGGTAPAKENIASFHAKQCFVGQKVETAPGVFCWQKAVPIEKVGLYIPGGTAPLFSTVLMLGVPARIAGCREIVLCTPPGCDGRVHPAVLFAAKVAGVNRVLPG